MQAMWIEIGMALSDADTVSRYFEIAMRFLKLIS